MDLLSIGYSHKTVSFDFLSRVALPAYFLGPFLRTLVHESPIREVVGLSTCNRTEFYLVTEDPCAASRFLLEALATARGMRVEEVADCARILEGDDVVRHLFSVASGIDSLVVGEQEIMGQVRGALEVACEAGTTTDLLPHLVTRALQAGRRVRSETNISRGKVSIATVAAQLIEERVANLRESTVLVIGTGEIGQLTAAAIANRGVRTLMLANRSHDKASMIARKMGCLSVPIDEMMETLHRADVAICAAGAPHFIITREMAESAGRCVYLDLSAPPNIAPDVRHAAGAEVLTIADLEEIADRNTNHRAGEVSVAQAIVDREVAAWQRWRNKQPAEGLVADLRRDVERIRREHLDRNLRRFDEEDRGSIDQFSRSLVSAILHRLTKNLESLDHDAECIREKVAFARALFSLEKEMGRPSPDEPTADENGMRGPAECDLALPRCARSRASAAD